MTEPVLSLSGLSKRYGDANVVRQLSLQLRPGECYGLLGPNGAGKTTTLRLCLGLIAPDAGDIRLLGEPIPERARAARMRVGIVPQIDNLDPDFSVEENVRVYGRYFGLSRVTLDERLPNLLDFAGLTSKKDAQIQTLSGGMKRRLTLARALVNDPDLLFLDEPTTGLDPQARHLIWERLKQLLARGKTILLTTHFMDEAERLCHRLAVIDHGQMIAEGTPRGLIEQYIEPEVVEIYGDAALEWYQAHRDWPDVRFEQSGETVFAYVRDAQPLLAVLQSGLAGIRYLHRPANLEDVFLKLTGREIRE